MRVLQNASPYPNYFVQKPIEQLTDRNVGRNVSVVKYIDPTATKLLYSCVQQEWGVSVTVRIVWSVGRDGRGSQVKGRLVSNASFKSVTNPFFCTKKIGKSNRRIFNLHLFYTQSESSNTLEKWCVSSDG